MDEDRFKNPAAVTVAKRAGNQCSNPDCGAITSGPSDEPGQSVNVGEAAHIYGAHEGSARYEAEMSAAQRSDVTNALWLCRNCHKLVDADQIRYPAGLLFEWKRLHERRIGEEMGKPGYLARQRYLKRHLGEFSGLSYLSEQIVIDKPAHWEYKLTSEVLRTKAGPVIERWTSLKRGLYSRPITAVSVANSLSWIQARNGELTNIVGALGTIVRDEFQAAWGPPGVPGSDSKIVSVCELFAEACSSALHWEEDVRFAQLQFEFEKVRELFVGVAGAQLDEVAKIPAYLEELFAGEPTPGRHHLQLTFSVPSDWPERLRVALEVAVEGNRYALASASRN